MPALPDELPGTRSSETTRNRQNASGPLSVGDFNSNRTMRIGGGIALAGVITGIALLLLACAGFNAAFCFSPVVLFLGLTGAILSLIGLYRIPATYTGPALASLFIALLAMLGGILEFAVWRRWNILFINPI